MPEACTHYQTCAHHSLPRCRTCGAPTSLDGHGDTRVASLQSDRCLRCERRGAADHTEGSDDAE